MKLQKYLENARVQVRAMAYIAFLNQCSQKPGELPESHIALFEFYELNFVTFC